MRSNRTVQYSTVRFTHINIFNSVRYGTVQYFITLLLYLLYYILYKGVLRLDKLMRHINYKHPEFIHAEGRSLLDMGFTMTRADDGPSGPESAPVDESLEHHFNGKN